MILAQQMAILVNSLDLVAKKNNQTITTSILGKFQAVTCKEAIGEIALFIL